MRRKRLDFDETIVRIFFDLFPQLVLFFQVFGQENHLAGLGIEPISVKTQPAVVAFQSYLQFA